MRWSEKALKKSFGARRMTLTNLKKLSQCLASITNSSTTWPPRRSSSKRTRLLQKWPTIWAFQKISCLKFCTDLKLPETPKIQSSRLLKKMQKLKKRMWQLKKLHPQQATLSQKNRNPDSREALTSPNLQPRNQVICSEAPPNCREICPCAPLIHEPQQTQWRGPLWQDRSSSACKSTIVN